MALCDIRSLLNAPMSDIVATRLILVRSPVKSLDVGVKQTGGAEAEAESSREENESVVS